MSNHNSAHKGEHGTISSYVVGFILSLIFTFIPYYLVVNKVLSGSSLVLTIIGIGIAQMVIQLVFFLHLGRGPKPFYNVVFFFATGGAIVVVIGASLIIMDNLYRNMSPEEAITRIAQEENIAQLGGEETGACIENKESHLVTLENGTVTPAFTAANRCDTLTFINKDDFAREIAFGTHPEDISFGGMFEVGVRVGRSETITLNQVGSFSFHDHRDANVSGYFSVAE